MSESSNLNLSYVSFNRSQRESFNTRWSRRETLSLFDFTTKIINVSHFFSNFEIRRLPARSNTNLNIEGGPEEPNNMLSTHQIPPTSYASSRSMSNLHRSNASPHRTRRQWDKPAEYSAPNGHVYQQPIPNPQINSMIGATGMGMSTSISLQGLRSPNNYESSSPSSLMSSGGPKNSFAPVPQRIVPGTYTNQSPKSPYQHQQHQYPGGQSTSNFSSTSNYYNEENFDRSTASRNSLTKKFMNLSSGSGGGSTGANTSMEPKTVWTPQKYESNRRPSNLFNNFSTPTQGIHRRRRFFFMINF